ncbi:ligase-associated DNA damage response endonuclease PdeM [Aquimonas sp.]|uniref:ligase-associated DNA damage response endonuclease PdeM n=1 Tax=Aquimonas sp. TaxID=1872588 RepID=UPI0037C0D288
MAEPAVLANSTCITLGGVQLQLLPERALFWPAEHTLCIADLHLGKGDVFRRAGIALPRGGTALDLARLTALLSITGARRLLVLGDLIHGPLPADAHWRQLWNEFAEAHPQVEFDAVLGNHDRQLRDASSFSRLQRLPAATQRGGLRLLHEPPALTEPGFALCGHVHPVLRLRQPGLPPRLPAFWRRGNQLVLPAFSDFSGGWAVRPSAGEMLWACAGTELLEVHGSARTASV